MQNSSENTGPALTVLYDGACPLCRREIGVYQNLKPLAPGQVLKFLDISQPESPLPAGGDRSAYLARFHVQRSDGQILSGAAAFVALWATLPGWRFLAWAARLPGATPLLELVYRVFLKFRPHMQGVAKAFEMPRVTQELAGDLRSDHAGETGAVWIYHGLLAVSGDAGVRDFARRHRATEQTHLDKINAVLPWSQRSWLLPGWRVAGFLTGALPALFGPRAVYATIAAVETFVDQHYQHQIDKLQGRPEHAALLEMLMQCQQEECEHRDEAIRLGAAVGDGTNSRRDAEQGKGPTGWLLRAWCSVVGNGSALAVKLAHRL